MSADFTRCFHGMKLGRPCRACESEAVELGLPGAFAAREEDRARHERRMSRVLAIVLVCALVSTVCSLLQLLGGCGDDVVAPADAASCSDLGCDGPLLCDSKGACVCDGVRCDP